MVTPLLLETRDDLAEPVDIAAGERRSRLVEQQEARLAEDRARDLDLLLNGEIEIADFAPQIDVEAETRRNAREPRVRRRRRIMPVAALRRIGQKHVVEHGQIRHQRHFLKRRLDAVAMRDPRRTQAHLVAENADCAVVGLDQTGKEFDDGRFAGAVFAEQRMDACLARW